MKNFSFTYLKTIISNFLHRFHVTIFVILFVGGLSLVTLFLQQVIAIVPPSASSGIDSESTFDETTMARIKSLHTTTDQSTLILPNGRTNPFTP